MNLRDISIHRFGEKSILINWEETINEDLLYFILKAKELIKANYKDSNIEVTNTYSSLLIKDSRFIKDFHKEKKELQQLISSVEHYKKQSTRLFKLPVCYDTEYGIDLDEVARVKKQSRQEIIELHTAAIYTVFFQGFLPGFLYLGGLDSRLHIPRKKEPRLKVRKGSVGLADKQTGIYPQDSAGGWQIIGNCPVNLFDATKKPPGVFKAGDQLQFEAVSKEKYHQIKASIDRDNYRLMHEKIEL